MLQNQDVCPHDFPNIEAGVFLRDLSDSFFICLRTDWFILLGLLSTSICSRPFLSRLVPQLLS
jgi:hypothetical protein